MSVFMMTLIYEEGLEEQKPIKYWLPNDHISHNLRGSQKCY